MKTPRLLIVEDDPAYQISLEMLIENLDFGFVIVASAEAALAQAEQTRFDLALLDINLASAMTGIELAGLLMPQYGIPVIFLTGNDDLDTYEKARQTAGAAYLVKPVNALTLRSIIETTLQKNSFDLQADKKKPANAGSAPAAPDFFYLKLKGRSVRVMTHEIMYVQADGNYCYLHTKQRRFVVKTSLSKVKEKLPASSFVQIHRSYLTQLRCITRVDLATQTVQIEQEHLPLGAHYKDGLLLRLHRI